MFWNIALLVGMWIVGIVLYSWGIMQILIELFCAFPLTRQLNKVCFIDAGAIYRRGVITITICALIAATVISLTFVFGNIYARIGICVGMGFSFLLSLGKWGMNQNNVSDYMNSYGKFIDQVSLECYIDYLNSEDENNSEVNQ